MANIPSWLRNNGPFDTTEDNIIFDAVYFSIITHGVLLPYLTAIIVWKMVRDLISAFAPVV